MSEAASCAYCQSPIERRADATHDHVIPVALRRAYKSGRRTEGRPRIPREFLGTVPAHKACNLRKGNRRLVPPSWAHLVDGLNAFFRGAEWQVWDGGRLPEVAR